MRGKRQWLVLLLVLLGFSLSQQKIPVTFTYDPPMALEVRSVSLRGNFNNWAELPLQKTPEGVWRVTLELARGLIQCKFFINGQ